MNLLPIGKILIYDVKRRCLSACLHFSKDVACGGLARRGMVPRAMDNIVFLLNESGLVNKRFLGFSLLACISTIALTGVIISGASGQASIENQGGLFFKYLLCFVLFVGTRGYILDRTTDAVEDVISKIRIKVCDQINKTELTAFEKLDKATIQTALGRECQVISSASNALMISITGLMVLLSAFVYMAIVAPQALIFIFIAVVAILLISFAHTKSVKAELRIASLQEEHFFRHLNSQLAGFKELRINEAKAKDLFDNDIVKVVDHAKQQLQITQRKLNKNMIFAQAAVYVLLGLVVFVLPEFLDQRHFPTSTMVALLLFASDPIGSLADSAKMFYRASEAIDRVKALQARLTSIQMKGPVIAQKAASPFQSLRCEGLTFQYPAQPGRRDDRFQIGPLDLNVQRGEIVFFIGGNGSGKSTLLNLLCGLYQPSQGRLLANGSVVTPALMAQFRAYFSIVLQDFYLFDRLLGHPRIDLDRVHHLLDMLNLRGVTDIDAHGKILNRNLSTGQKKRLALLGVECEDRDIFVFDEWAADQDPEFRLYFYETYLPEMRARGKTILAATHDDKYFHTADRVIRLDRGQLSEVTEPGTIIKGS